MQKIQKNFFLGLLGFVLGFFVAFVYDKTMLWLFSGKRLVIGGWILHHSLYGIPFLIFGAWSKKMMYLGFGLGVIVQHSLTDGFWFVTKSITT